MATAWRQVMLLCTIHAADETSARWVIDRLIEAYTLQPQPAQTLPILLDRIAAA